VVTGLLSQERIQDLRFAPTCECGQLEKEVWAWQEKRNAKKAKVDWQFTTVDARIKLKKLYPSIEA
jgi:hypothetical protein